MPDKQIDFPPNQKHSQQVTLWLWAICIVCIVFVVIAIQVVGGGGL